MLYQDRSFSIKAISFSENCLESRAGVIKLYPSYNYSNAVVHGGARVNNGLAKSVVHGGRV